MACYSPNAHLSSILVWASGCWLRHVRWSAHAEGRRGGPRPGNLVQHWWSGLPPAGCAQGIQGNHQTHSHCLDMLQEHGAEFHYSRQRNYTLYYVSLTTPVKRPEDFTQCAPVSSCKSHLCFHWSIRHWFNGPPHWPSLLVLTWEACSCEHIVILYFALLSLAQHKLCTRTATSIGYVLGWKYSLLTQFRRLSGMRPTMARLTSPAAISRSSVMLWSL